SSHNLARWGTHSDIRGERMLLQPKRIAGVYEFPVSCFQDRPGHWRPAQLAAASARELEWALLRAWRQGWHAFVIVSHSFELIKRRDRDGADASVADRVVIRRLQRLCRFLALNRDKFQTATF